MKRRIFPVLLACMLLVAFTAHAAPACTLHFDYGQAALSLKAEGLLANSQYFLLVSRSDASAAAAMNDNNLVWMDMVETNANGQLNLALVNMAFNENLKVLLGGVFEDVVSPCTLGTLQYTAQTLPADLTAIHAEAFMGAAFESVYVSEQVTSIGDRAFQGCQQLRTIYIMNDQVSFGQDVFAGCEDVVLVCSEGSSAAAYAQGLDNVTCRYR